MANKKNNQLPPVKDPNPTRLRQAIMNIKRRRGHSKASLKKDEVNRQVFTLVWNWLDNNGRFLKAEDEAYWFSNLDHHLYRVDPNSEIWRVLMAKNFDINVADDEYRFVAHQIRYKILGESEKAEVHIFSHYDPDNNKLYVSSFDGKMYRLDGKDIKHINNGEDGVLFLDHPTYQPYEADFENSSSTGIDKIIEGITFDEANLSSSQQRLVFKTWFLSMPFTSLLPTRPLVLMVGIKGSGKTSIFRRILRLLFGSDVDVLIMNKSKPDAFVAATSSQFLTVWDNVDAKVTWLNDLLATASTGGKYSLRKLYTTNDEYYTKTKAHVGLTARTPKFNRDDVADRMLILHVDRIKDYKPECQLLSIIDKNRNVLMGEYLTNLNRIVKKLASRNINAISNFRMADWALLGLEISEAFGLQAEFQECLDKITKEQEAFSLEDDPLCVVLRDMIEKGMNLDNSSSKPKRFTAGELYRKLEYLADDLGIKWSYPHSLALANRLSQVQEALGHVLGIKINKQKGHNNQFLYEFGGVGGVNSNSSVVVQSKSNIEKVTESNTPHSPASNRTRIMGPTFEEARSI